MDAPIGVAINFLYRLVAAAGGKVTMTPEEYARIMNESVEFSMHISTPDGNQEGIYSISINRYDR